MPGDKVTHKISELQKEFSSDQLKSSTFYQTIHSLKLSAHFKEFNYLKHNGYSFHLVLSVLIWLIIQSETTVNSALSKLSDQGIKLKKDVLYRLKNSEKICWRRLLWYIVSKFLQSIEKDTEKTGNNAGQKKPRCLIFDDTLLKKTGKSIGRRC